MPDRAELELVRLLDATHQLSHQEEASSLGLSLGQASHCFRRVVLAWIGIVADTERRHAFVITGHSSVQRSFCASIQ
jgi:hypothetical protein